jgi:hypothetical protein
VDLLEEIHLRGSLILPLVVGEVEPTLEVTLGQDLQPLVVYLINNVWQ